MKVQKGLKQGMSKGRGWGNHGGKTRDVKDKGQVEVSGQRREMEHGVDGNHGFLTMMERREMEHGVGGNHGFPVMMD